MYVTIGWGKNLRHDFWYSQSFCVYICTVETPICLYYATLSPSVPATLQQVKQQASEGHLVFKEAVVPDLLMENSPAGR